MAPAVLLLAVLLVLPLSYLIELSFREAVPGSLQLQPGFTLSSYVRVLGDSYYLWIVFQTLLLSIAVTLVCAIFGFPLGYFLWRVDPRYKGLLTLLVIAPLLISLVVRAYGWMVLLGDTGLVNQLLRAVGIADAPFEIMFTNTAVFLGLVHVQFPFLVLSVLAVLERIDPFLIDAAETLGASRLRAITSIVLPLAIPGLMAGMILVFTLSMTAFVTPALLGGSGTRVMTTLVYNQFTVAFNWPLGAALAVVLSVLSLAVIAFFTFFARRTSLVKKLEQAGA